MTEDIKFRDPTIEDADIGRIAGELLEQESKTLRLDGDHMPGPVRDSFQDYRAAVTDLLAIERGLREDLADLDSRRDTMPREGYRRLRREAREEARARTAEADRAAREAFGRLEAVLEGAALPQVDASREALARDEAKMLLDAGTPEIAATELASRGSREALSVVASEWGRSYFKSRGLAGPDVDRIHRQVRETAAAVAAENGSTEIERNAGSALRKLGRLATARGAARSAVRRLTDPSG